MSDKTDPLAALRCPKCGELRRLLDQRDAARRMAGEQWERARCQASHVRVCLEEIDDLEAELSTVKRLWAEDQERCEGLRVELAEARWLLSRAESAIEIDDCPVCAVMGRDASGHRPDCRLAAFLARHPEVTT